MLKQTNTKFKRRLTVAGIVAVAIAAIVPVASSSAWGPERTTFTIKKPAKYAVFNSITDNPGVGDERNFVRVMEVGTDKTYTDTRNVTPGKEYEVYIYYHNNAATTYNNTEGAPGIAKQVRVATGLSTWTINSSKKAKISAIISSTNTNPKEVWDEAYLTTTSKSDVVLRYVTNSAKIHNGFKSNNSELAKSALFSSQGVLIGTNTLNGYIPGCAEYSGYITYRVRADQPGSTITKTVSKDGKNFYKTVDAKPGDTLTYKVEFKNTGTLDLSDVTFHDKLPTGVTLVNGTTVLTDKSRPNGVKMSDVIGKNGFNAGLYSKGTNAVITYKVKVNADAVKDKKCSSTTSFVNKIYANYKVSATGGTGELYDSSTIKVNKTCDEGCKDDDLDCICKENPNDSRCKKTPTCKEDDLDCICKENPNDSRCKDEPDCKDGDPDCTTPDEPDCDENDQDCICTKDPKNPICTTTPELPKTGPGEIALAIIAVVGIATGGVYWYRSRKDLSTVQNSLDKKDDK